MKKIIILTTLFAMLINFSLIADEQDFDNSEKNEYSMSVAGRVFNGPEYNGTEIIDFHLSGHGYIKFFDEHYGEVLFTDIRIPIEYEQTGREIIFWDVLINNREENTTLFLTEDYSALCYADGSVVFRDESIEWYWN
jgi:hypothetical protein